MKGASALHIIDAVDYTMQGHIYREARTFLLPFDGGIGVEVCRKFKDYKSYTGNDTVVWKKVSLQSACFLFTASSRQRA
jgi:hypothetical protein